MLVSGGNRHSRCAFAYWLKFFYKFESGGDCQRQYAFDYWLKFLEACKRRPQVRLPLRGFFICWEVASAGAASIAGALPPTADFADAKFFRRSPLFYREKFRKRYVLLRNIRFIYWLKLKRIS